MPKKQTQHSTMISVQEHDISAPNFHSINSSLTPLQKHEYDSSIQLTPLQKHEYASSIQY